MQDTRVTLSESLSINLSFNLIPIDLPDDPLTLRHRLLANEVGLREFNVARRIFEIPSPLMLKPSVLALP